MAATLKPKPIIEINVPHIWVPKVVPLVGFTAHKEREESVALQQGSCPQCGKAVKIIRNEIGDGRLRFECTANSYHFFMRYESFFAQD